MPPPNAATAPEPLTVAVTIELPDRLLLALRTGVLDCREEARMGGSMPPDVATMATLVFRAMRFRPMLLLQAGVERVRLSLLLHPSPVPTTEAAPRPFQAVASESIVAPGGKPSKAASRCRKKIQSR